MLLFQLSQGAGQPVAKEKKSATQMVLKAELSDYLLRIRDLSTTLFRHFRHESQNSSGAERKSFSKLAEKFSTFLSLLSETDAKIRKADLRLTEAGKLRSLALSLNKGLNAVAQDVGKGKGPDLLIAKSYSLLQEARMLKDSARMAKPGGGTPAFFYE